MRLLLDGQTDTARDVPVVPRAREARGAPAGGAARVARHVPRNLPARARAGDALVADALARRLAARGAIALGNAARARAVLRGRDYAIADDIHDLAVPVLAHRVRLATHADGFVPTRDEAETAVREIVARVPVPL